MKDAGRRELLGAIRAVAAGDALLARGHATRSSSGSRTRPGATRPAPRGSTTLTEREREVLELVATALSNTEIATHLYLSETTVKTHVGRVLAKLGARDRVQLVVFAYEHGLAVPGRSGGRELAGVKAGAARARKRSRPTPLEARDDPPTLGPWRRVGRSSRPGRRPEAITPCRRPPPA